ncbi:MAG: DNA alkylation repair protein [Candidatus Kapaibacterium sp.]
MSAIAETIVNKLLKEGSELKAMHLSRFFKTGKGQYGEGDIFIGVTVPVQRKIAREHFREADFEDLRQLITDPRHECRLTGLIMLTYKYEKSGDKEQKEMIKDFYLDMLDHVNNWDLVDLTAYKILGDYLMDKDRRILYELAESGHLWRQRVSVISTMYFIKKGDFGDTFALAEMMIDHKHDLMHKAIGWMLREIGKIDFEAENAFLREHYQQMPRTMLRYAIEKFNPELRKQFLSGKS